jgi:hypothetical protein
MPNGFSRGNDADSIASPCVYGHKYSAESIHSDCDVALFITPGILNRYGVRVIENSEGVGE